MDVLQSYKSLTTLGFLACVSPFYFHMRGFDSSHSHCVFLVLVIKEIDISPSLSSLLASPSPLPSPFDSTVMKKCLFLRFRYHCYLYKIKESSQIHTNGKTWSAVRKHTHQPGPLVLRAPGSAGRHVKQRVTVCQCRGPSHLSNNLRMFLPGWAGETEEPHQAAASRASTLRTLETGLHLFPQR